MFSQLTIYMFQVAWKPRKRTIPDVWSPILKWWNLMIMASIRSQGHSHCWSKVDFQLVKSQSFGAVPPNPQFSLLQFSLRPFNSKIPSAGAETPGLWGLSLVGHPAMHARTPQGPHPWRPQRRVRLPGWQGRAVHHRVKRHGHPPWLDNPKFWMEDHRQTGGISVCGCLSTRVCGYGCLTTIWICFRNRTRI